MRSHASIALAVLGGGVTLALAASLLLRLATPQPRVLPVPCAPRLLELERAVCDSVPARDRLAELSLAAPR